AVLGGDRDWAREHAMAAASASRRAGALRRVVAIYEGTSDLFAGEPLGARAAVGLAETRYDLGQYEAALSDARRGQEGLPPGERAAATALLGRVLVALGRLEEAVAVLDEAAAGASPGPDRARVLRDLARVQMRRG